jgi:hypothetical protein
MHPNWTAMRTFIRLALRRSDGHHVPDSDEEMRVRARLELIKAEPITRYPVFALPASTALTVVSDPRRPEGDGAY